jgi:hypothetical protein
LPTKITLLTDAMPISVLKNILIHQCPVGRVLIVIIAYLAFNCQTQNYALQTVYGTF